MTCSTIPNVLQERITPVPSHLDRSAAMKTLLLIPSVVKPLDRNAVASDGHPTMDYHALAAALGGAPGSRVDIFDYATVSRSRHPVVRLALRAGGPSLALAWLGFAHHREYDAIFSNGENIAIPLALLLKGARRRPGHVTIGHRLSARKKRVFYRSLRVQDQMDAVFVYATSQREYARQELGIPAGKLSLIHFHADERFYRPSVPYAVDEDQICSAGLEWRDYETLIGAVETMPGVRLRLAAASPWSKHVNHVAGRPLPPNVDAREYDYYSLRELYATSSIVAVSLYETDFQAGVTTILEAMAMGKPVIVTRTTGQTDVVIDGQTGLTVAAGDVDGWRRAITRLRTDPDLRLRLGRNAREWFEQNATLTCWVQHLAGALEAAGCGHQPGPRRSHAEAAAS